MRRLEHRKSNKFLELELDGPELVIRRGKIGKPGKVERKVHASVAAAEADANNKYRARQRKKGWFQARGREWTLVDPAPAPAAARNPELEALLRERPRDREAWAVYADWLQAHDDLWGERIGLSLAQGERPQPSDPVTVLTPEAELAQVDDLDARVAELDIESSERLHGVNLARLMARRDFPQLATLDSRHGFIVGARLHRGGTEFQYWGNPTLNQVTRALIESPAIRFLERLTFVAERRNSHAHLPRALAYLRETSDVFESLRHLGVELDEELVRLLSDEVDLRPVLGNFDWLLAGAPRLVGLKLAGVSLELSALDHLALQKLTLDLDVVATSTIEAIAAARLPACEDLKLSVGLIDDRFDLLEPLFAGEGLPRLSRLALSAENSEEGDRLVEQLGRAALVPRLELLDLSHVPISEAGVEALHEGARTFNQATEVRIPSYLAPALIGRARELDTRVWAVSPRNW